VLQRHLERDGPPRALSLERDPGAGRAEADELLVGTRARREALRADVERFEQVRLAGAVRPGDEDEPGLQPELEAFVAAEVSERDVPDDQAPLLSPRA
jgi:hypothetical protein